jgi:hypothetical protein
MRRDLPRWLPADLDPKVLAVYRRMHDREMVTRERIFRAHPSGLVNSVPGEGGRYVPARQIRQWRSRIQVFAFRHQGRDYFPLFQFEDAHPKPLIERLLRIVRPADGWNAMYWFIGANGWLESDSPLDHLDTGPEEVIEAARHYDDAISD